MSAVNCAKKNVVVVADVYCWAECERRAESQDRGWGRKFARSSVTNILPEEMGRQSLLLIDLKRDSL
jgi:hypothetical protein